MPSPTYYQTHKKKIRDRVNQYRRNNREKILLREAAYRAKNKKSIKSKNLGYYYADKNKFRNRQLKARYGISLDDYNNLVTKQNGVCKICEKTNGSQNLYVDHDHVTGKIRSLLCRSCNVGIGHFRDNPELLKRAMNYLTK